jgi:three-Cys-motif partner protein
MRNRLFHDRPYDSGTIAKLDIFEAYTQAWLPVFLSQPDPPFPEIHIFDFFCGPGMDSEGNYGSPLRILRQLRDYQNRGQLHGWSKVQISVHFSDSDSRKCEALREEIVGLNLVVPGVAVSVHQRKFDEALEVHKSILQNSRAPKLLIMDQFGVNAVTDDVFSYLTKLPKTDFIFFLSSSILNRFRDHPSIKVKIERPEESYNVHRAAFDHFLGLSAPEYFMGRFSIKKPTGNIYGLIFGSAHPLGISKFLEIAWSNDGIAGEANFDIDRECIRADELLLDLPEMRPKKIQLFEQDLEVLIRQGIVSDEFRLLRYAIKSGMTSRHCRPVLKKLKEERVIECNFAVPNVRNAGEAPRRINLL